MTDFSKTLMCIILVFIFFACKPTVHADCDYKIDGYRLSKNKSGMWGIIDNNGDVLGYSTRYHHYSFYTFDSNEAMTFGDSCKAKGLLKQYIQYIDENSLK